MKLFDIIILSYILIINVVGFVLCGIDKRRSKKNMWRIQETTLFNTALIGGAVGLLFGMKLFRHKTKHKSFTVFIPIIIIVQILILVYLFYSPSLKI